MKRLDEIGFGGYKIYQNSDAFCYGVDAVLLAIYAKEHSGKQVTAQATAQLAAMHTQKTGARALDICTGNGIIPIILAAETDWKIDGVELQEEAASLASESVELNCLAERIKIFCQDACEFTSDEPYDVITINPPYVKKGSGLSSGDQRKHIARTETTASLEDFLKAASRLVKDKGDVFMIHRPSRLVDIFCSARKVGLEPKEIEFVSPMPGEEPNLVLIHFIKGAGPELKISNGFAVHDIAGNYTEELLRRYSWKLPSTSKKD